MNKKDVIELLVIPRIVAITKFCKTIGIKVDTNIDHSGTLSDSVPDDVNLTKEIQTMSHMLTPDEFYAAVTARYERERELDEQRKSREAQKREEEAELDAIVIAELSALEHQEALAREHDARLSLIEKEEETTDGNRDTKNNGGEFPFGSGAGGAPNDRR